MADYRIGRRRPGHQVLSDARLEVAERQEFTAEHRWSLPELADYVHSEGWQSPRG
jgi:hypothetical protein